MLPLPNALVDLLVRRVLRRKDRIASEGRIEDSQKEVTRQSSPKYGYSMQIRQSATSQPNPSPPRPGLSGGGSRLARCSELENLTTLGEDGLPTAPSRLHARFLLMPTSWNSTIRCRKIQSSMCPFWNQQRRIPSGRNDNLRHPPVESDGGQKWIVDSILDSRMYRQ